ncbi:hypothetical protein J2T21_000565 [Paeniglutamicibacter psychrophenolicus]|nr:hypothetical protein [Paeniglutamicibacter psychrophenolicus]
MANPRTPRCSPARPGELPHSRTCAAGRSRAVLR